MIRWFEKHNKISWVITVLIAAGIFYVSSWTSEGIGKPMASWTTLAYHFFAFFFFAAFLLISLVQGKTGKKSFILIAFFIAVFYGITDEIHQMFVPGRHCAFFDFLINSSGIFIATLIYLVLLVFKKD